MNDALSANDERLLRDAERSTIVVLGKRGRGHIFSDAGRHVTSLRLRPGEVERKLDRGRWVRLSPDEASSFRERLRERLARRRDEDAPPKGA